MTLDSSELRISLQALLGVLIVILVPLTVVGLYFGMQADKHANQMNGEYLRTLTHSAAAATTEFIDQRVTEVSLIANEPSVVQAVTTANRAYAHVAEPAVQAKLEGTERKWNDPATDILARQTLTSDLADLLRRDRELNPKLLKIVVADEMGATVAATDKPLHYFQTDREYWRSLSSRGQGAIYLTDVRTDEQSRSNYISLSFPVLQEGSGRFIGAVTALIDVSPLFAYLNQQQIARTGRLFLIRDDGTVITAPGVAPPMKVKSDEYTAMRDALGTLRGRETGYITATLPDGESYLIGFADTGLKAAYPNLGWIVVASQAEREASGPVRNMAHYALLMMVLGLLLLAVFGAYVFLHRKQQLEDLETTQEDRRRSTAA